MIAGGYMAKKVRQRPEWLHTTEVEDIYSVSGCVSPHFAEYINYWKHNRHWFFNSPDVIRDLSASQNIDLKDTRMFYYELYELQFDRESGEWGPYDPEASFATMVVEPPSKRLEGYDVVTYSCRTSAECSPLSCNNMAGALRANRHCLLDSFDEAKHHIENGTFDHCEPGPYRIVAVYSVEGV